MSSGPSDAYEVSHHENTRTSLPVGTNGELCPTTNGSKRRDKKMEPIKESQKRLPKDRDKITSFKVSFGPMGGFELGVHHRSLLAGGMQISCSKDVSHSCQVHQLKQDP